MSEAYEAQDEHRGRVGPLANGHDTEPADPTLVHWARFRDRFAEALAESGFWTLDDLEARIATRTAFFFPGTDAALVGQIEFYPSGERAFVIRWAVGADDERVLMMPGVEALARMMGCTSMIVEDRADLPAKLPGYEPWVSMRLKVL